MMAFAASENVYASTEVSTVMEKKQKAEIKTVTFSSNIHCANCAKKVKENISFEKGVTALEVSVEQKRITISYNAAKTSPEKLAAAIRKLGYTAELSK